MSSSCRLACRGLAAAAVLLSGAAGAQHRCDVDGRVQFQDTPCPSAAKAAEPPARAPDGYRSTKARPPIGDPDYERAREQQRARELDAYAKGAGAALAARTEARTKACGANADSEPFIGAAAEWVRTCSAWGSPTGVSTTQTSHGTTQRWTYPQATIFFDPGGRVAAIVR